MERVSLFVISIVVVAMVVTGLGVFYSGISTEYGVSNTQNLSAYNQMEGINNITSSLDTKINAQPTSTGGFAVLGDFLSYGYNTLVLTFQSYNFFYVMLEYSFTGIPTGDEGSGAIQLIKSGIATIVFLLIIFALIAILTQRQQL
jgi:hypothetical protein